MPGRSRSTDGDDLVVRLADLTIAGIALYVLLDVVAQLLPPHYSALRQAESDLAVGPYGALMTFNFVLRGLLSLALVAALWRTLDHSRRAISGLVLISVWGLASALLALFPTDVPGSARVSTHGAVHLALALLAFVAVAAGELLLSLMLTAPTWSSGPRVWARTVAGAGACCLLLLLAGCPLHQFTGLRERLFLGAALFWMLLVAFDLRHAARSGGRRVDWPVDVTGIAT